MVSVQVLPAVDHVSSHAAKGERGQFGAAELFGVVQTSELWDQVESAHLDSFQLAYMAHSPG